MSKTNDIVRNTPGRRDKPPLVSLQTSGSTDTRDKNARLSILLNESLFRFEVFLDTYRIEKSQHDERSENKLPATHASMSTVYKKMGSFSIPNDKLDLFFDFYCHVVFELSFPLGIVERPLLEKSILKYDFDFKYSSDNLERTYSITVVEKIVEIFQNILVIYIEKDKDDIFHSYVFQRDGPYRKDKVVKDGIHIMYPNIYLEYSFHHFIRGLVINELIKMNLESYIPFTNSIQDVVDESVIQRNGWLMYGSTKEGIKPYELVGIYDEDMNLIENNMSERELSKFLSIRKIIPESKIIKEYIYEDMKKKRKKLDWVEINKAKRVLPASPYFMDRTDRTDRTGGPQNDNRNRFAFDIDALRPNNDQELAPDFMEDDFSHYAAGYQLCTEDDITLEFNQNRMDNLIEHGESENINKSTGYELIACDSLNRQTSGQKRTFSVMEENCAGSAGLSKDETNMENIGNTREKLFTSLNYHFIEKLVGMLSHKRAFDYNLWLEVGMCLHNISQETKYFELWLMFSKQNFDAILTNIQQIVLSEKRVNETQRFLGSDEFDGEHNSCCEYLENDLSDWEEILKTKPEICQIQNLIRKKYIDDEQVFDERCFEKWQGFSQKADGLSYGSLIFWAKKDNFNVYKLVRSTKMRKMIEETVLNPSHAKIAALLYVKYKDLYICSDYEKGIWYEWKDHCWKRMDGNSTIRRKITGTSYDSDNILNDVNMIKNIVAREKIDNNLEFIVLKEEYEKLNEERLAKYNKLLEFKKKYGETATIPDLEGAVKAITNELKQKRQEYVKKHRELLKRFIKPYEDTIQKFLETSPSIDNIVKEAKQEFYNKVFNSKINTNPDLFLFRNGVYDLEKMVFRDGVPDDYITLETDEQQICYQEYDLENDVVIKKIEDYFKKVLVDEEKRNYFLLLIASCLEGYNTNNIFPILTGSGSNSKSMTMNFIEECFGAKYSGKLNSAFLTQKRNKSSSASPEYYGIADCRIISSEESDMNDELNTAIIKEITGNSKISSRTLFQSKMTTKTPQFTPFLICNDLPLVKSLDGGTWRRIAVISFDSKFVDNTSDPKWSHLPNVFQIDRNLKSQHMDKWKEPFMFLLIHKYYRQYRENNKNIVAPECVKAYTNKFKDENDILQPFIESNIQTTGQRTDCIKIKELYQKILLWFREHHQGEKEPTQPMIKKYFESKYGTYDSKGWIGKKFVDL